MKLSIIIPTKNRHEDLINTLKSIFIQTLLPSEIIIADQNIGSDVHNSVLSLFSSLDESSKGKVSLKYIHDPLITGLTQARNIAVERNESDIVLFLDDDVILEKDFILNILKIYRKYPEIYGVSGVATNSQRGLLGDILYKIFMKGNFTDKRYFVNTDTRYSHLEYVEVSKLTGFAMSYRKEVFKEFSFDEHFVKYGLLEDVDFSFRVSNIYKTVITPKARLIHVFSEMGRADQSKTIESILLSLKYFYKKNLDNSIYDCLCFAWVMAGYLVYSSLLLVSTHSTDALKGYVRGIRKLVMGGDSDFVKY